MRCAACCGKLPRFDLFQPVLSALKLGKKQEMSLEKEDAAIEGADKLPELPPGNEPQAAMAEPAPAERRRKR